MTGSLQHQNPEDRNNRYWLANTTNKPKDTHKDRVTITYNTQDKSYNIYLTDYITGPEEYTNVFDTLLNAVEENTIIFILATGGGRLDTTNKIRGLAKITKAKTVAIVGDVASAGTILALSFDDIIVIPNIEFMIHNYSGEVGGKAHEIYTHSAFLQKEMPQVFKEYYKDFLTEEELSSVLLGQDIYLNSFEVEERWENVIKVRDKHKMLIKEDEINKQNLNFKKILEKNGYVVKLQDIPTPKGKKPPVKGA